VLDDEVLRHGARLVETQELVEQKSLFTGAHQPPRIHQLTIALLHARTYRRTLHV